MRKLTVVYITATALSFSAAAFADELTLPYPDFKPGSPAYANSVDANFEALRSGINGNTGKITVNTADIEANSSSISHVRSVLDDHGHSPGDLTPQGPGSGLNADLLDGSHSTAFAESVHRHVPGDLTSQGPGSGLDADLLDGMDSGDLAAADHGHDMKYTLIGHNHPAEEITGSVNADTLDDLDSSSFAPADHVHPDYALSHHLHDAEYAALGHAHEELTAAVNAQEGRIGKLESYGDLSSVLDEISSLKRTISGLRSRIEELETRFQSSAGN